MKNIINIIIRRVIVLLVLITVSCQDAIDIDQPGRLISDVTFQTINDLEAGLFGIYASYDTTVEIRFNAIFTDEGARGKDNGGQASDLFNHILNSASGTPNAIWVQHYITISNINKILAAAENIERVDDPETGIDETELYDSVLGQLYALRAYSHFTLQAYFSTDYTDDSALGVILLDFVAVLGETRSRSTNGEVFSFINEDLDRAEGLLPVGNSDPTFVSSDFITALRARMAAYRQQYTQADTYASDILSRYSIATRAQYFSMYQDTNNTEVIFKLEREPGDAYDGQGTGGGGTAGSLFAFTNSSPAGGPFIEIGRDVFNQLDPTDIRYDVNVHPNSLIDPDYQSSADYLNTDVLAINKYSGSGGVDLLNDLKIFRIAEMLLIRAEALAASGDFNGATNSTAALIKQLRDARFGSDQSLPVFNNQEEAFGAIIDERRLELIYEGHRWLDLKRLGARGNRTIRRAARDCEATGACSLSATDFRFTLPIPLSELNVNQDIRSQQNPGY
ncbi:RagB/SusD family nutrient uptake outer membrane protein [Aquimarina rhabdastrellae]